MPPVNISIKLTALYSQFEPAAPESVSEVARARLRPLLRLAREHGAFINVDMEQYRYKDLVHHVFADVAAASRSSRDFSDVGIVVQAYLGTPRTTSRRLRDAGGASAARRSPSGSSRAPTGTRSASSPARTTGPCRSSRTRRDRRLLRALHRRAARRLAAPATGLRHATTRARSRRRRQGARRRPRATRHRVSDAVRHGGGAARRRRRRRATARASTCRSAQVIPGMAYLVRRLLENTSNQSWFNARRASEAAADELLAPPRPTAAGRHWSLTPRRHSATPPPAAVLHDPERAKRCRRRSSARDAASAPTYPLLIGDERVTDRELAEVRYPADPALCSAASRRRRLQDVDAAVAAAREAFPAWRDRAVPSERGESCAAPPT